MRYILNVCLITILFVLSGCSLKNDTSVSQKRQAILNMKNDVLSDLYKLKPDVRTQISNAYGYGVFDNANVNVILASFGGGKGVVKNNKTGKYTYMKMGEIGIGLGLGVKDFRVVFVFHTSKSLNNFVEKGWAFGAQADAAAKAGDKGGAIAGEVTVDNITIYQLTKNGLALQGTIKGTKFWKDDSLN